MLEEQLKEHLRMQPIPMQLVNMLMSNHLGKKKSLMGGSQLKIQHQTKETLDTIKRINKMASLSNTIDMLITTVALYQLNDMDDLSTVQLYDKDLNADIKYNGHTREVDINGRIFYSLASVARTYKCTKKTVLNRIKSMDSKWRKWNYMNEDVSVKYDKRRVLDEDN